jgi:excisionase family DNA binding protein
LGGESWVKTNEYPEIMNVEEVADFFRVSNQTIYNMLRAGKLPAVKVGREWRFPRDKIKAMVFEQGQEEQRVEPAARDNGDGLSKKDADMISRYSSDL